MNKYFFESVFLSSIMTTLIYMIEYLYFWYEFTHFETLMIYFVLIILFYVTD